MGEQQQLGRYELGAEIGRGSHGVVYQARDPIIDRPVAIKTIDFRRLGEGQAQAQERFFLEAKSAGRLSHPNIVTIYDAGEAQGCAYIAMELLEGVSLREMLDGHPPLAVGRALEIIAQVARGLAYAHEHGVVHRDIKPANIILIGSRRAKITDFGIARLNTTTHTAQEELAGSPKYMSPEQVRGDVIDGRSDLFSLGAMLYEMITGKQPFDGADPAAIMQAVIQQTPQQASTINTRIPRDVDKLLARMLAKSPEERYPSARALLRDLSSLMKKYSSPTIAETRQETLTRARRIKEARRRRVNEGEATIVMNPPRETAKRSERKLPMAAFYGMGAVGVAALAVIALTLHQVKPVEETAPSNRALNPSTLVDAATNSAGNNLRDDVAMPTTNASDTESPVSAPASMPRGPTSVDAPVAPIATETQTKPAVKAVRKPSPNATSMGPASAPSNVAVAQATTATLVVAISPWGEVWVDGESRGTAPPLSSIALTPGKHHIEIRNSGLPSYSLELEAGAGETRRIKHKFE